MTPALVLLDRDGVLNVNRPDFVKSPEELEIYPGVPEAVARLTDVGIRTAIVTNQSGIGRGLMRTGTLDAIHDKLLAAIEQAGGRIDAIYYAPDRPDQATEMRKPGPGMIHAALEKFQPVPADSVLIGDSLRDLQAAARAGCPRILVRTGHGEATERKGLPEEVLPCSVVNHFPEAVDTILAGRYLKA